MVEKVKYSIKKFTNGEFKLISKNFTLNLDKYCGNSSNLYFDVEGEELPVIIDANLFYSVVVEQIQKGLMERIIYDDGTIRMIIRDGNVLKNYLYDFSFSKLKENEHRSAITDLKRLVYKIVSMYNENPNNSISTEQRYLRVIFDIIDGNRIPIFSDPDEIQRIFEVYNANKPVILSLLLQNVIFYDKDNEIAEYGNHLKAHYLRKIKGDVVKIMEMAIYVFAAQNDALELYYSYLGDTYVPTWKVVERTEEELAAPEEEQSEEVKADSDNSENTMIENDEEVSADSLEDKEKADNLDKEKEPSIEEIKRKKKLLLKAKEVLKGRVESIKEATACRACTLADKIDQFKGAKL